MNDNKKMYMKYLEHLIHTLSIIFWRMKSETALCIAVIIAYPVLPRNRKLPLLTSENDEEFSSVLATGRCSKGCCFLEGFHGRDLMVVQSMDRVPTPVLWRCRPQRLAKRQEEQPSEHGQRAQKTHNNQLLLSFMLLPTQRNRKVHLFFSICAPNPYTALGLVDEWKQESTETSRHSWRN